MVRSVGNEIYSLKSVDALEKLMTKLPEGSRIEISMVGRGLGRYYKHQVKFYDNYFARSAKYTYTGHSVLEVLDKLVWKLKNPDLPMGVKQSHTIYRVEVIKNG